VVSFKTPTFVEQLTKTKTNIMIGAIPNPTKSITVNQSVEVVKEVVKNLPKTMSQLGHLGYTSSKSDDFMGMYTISKTETLSLGVNINVMVNGNQDTTTIDVEIARAIGAFDSWVEVSNANHHMRKLLETISYGLNPDPNVKLLTDEEVQSKENSNALWSFIIGLAVIGWVISAL